MYKLLFLIVFLSCSENIQKLPKKDIDYFEKDKESGLFRVKNKNRKWGFVDRDTIIKIPVKYDFINPFDENGLAYTKDNGKEFYIDRNGKIIISPDYEELDLFSEGFLRAKKNGKYGFLDTMGSIAVPFVYEEAGYFYQGLSAVSKDRKSGFINSTGKEVIPIMYDAVDNSHIDHIVIVSKNGKWAFFDNHGKQLSEFVYDKVFSGYNLNIPSPSNLSEVTTYFKNGAVLVIKDKKYEFLNEQMQPAFPKNKFDSASVFDTYKNAIVKRNGKYGIIKSNGIAKVPIQYDFAEYFDTNHNSSEYYNARKGKVFHIYNRDLKKIGESSEPIYNDFSSSSTVIIFKNLQGKYGMTNFKGDVLIPFDYKALQKLQSGYFLGEKDGKSGIIDGLGKVKVPFQYDRLDEFDEEKKLFIANGSRIININNKTILSGYDTLVPIYYNDKKFIVSKNKKYGIIDLYNKTLLPLEFDEISNWIEYGPEKKHFIVKNGKYGLIEHETFKTIIPPIYDEFVQREHLIFASKGRKAGILDINNKEVCPFIFDEIKPDVYFGYRNNELIIYSKKDRKFYKMDVSGKIIKQVSEKLYKDRT